MSLKITTSLVNPKKIPGVVFYEGPSLLDRTTPIIGIATFNSKNEKTGNLIQTWILHANQHPMEAIHQKSTPSICGRCPLQGLEEQEEDRGCYVRVDQAPAAVYRGHGRGIYLPLHALPPERLIEQGVRLGSYGDPTAIPLKKWKPLLKKIPAQEAKPGYTHQWTQKRFQHWSTRLMASTHSLEQNSKAHSLGWRTFRTISQVSDIASNEILCPASPEGNNRATCEACGACNGRRNMDDHRKNIAIVVHGRNKEAARRISLPIARG